MRSSPPAGGTRAVPAVYNVEYSVVKHKLGAGGRGCPRRPSATDRGDDIPALRYRNPVYDGYVADPFVLRTADGYVAFGTRDPAQPTRLGGLEFEILTSPDLVSWTLVGGALTTIGPEHGTDYWAPEVVEHAGRYHLYYSVGHGDRDHHLRVATADSPLGPYTDCGTNLTPGEMFAIDPHPFRDADGTWYVFYARDVLDGERVGTSLAVDVLEDMARLRGEPTPVLSATAEWQLFKKQRAIYDRTLDWYTLEGPCVVRRDGRYYLLYSGGSWQEPSYAVSWAVADHPLGPWKEPAGEDAWLLRTVEGRVIGPGHNSLTTTPDGTDVIVYHAWDPAQQRRRMCIDPLRWTANGPACPGPTWTDATL
jgi:beta-xylosidase